MTHSVAVIQCRVFSMNGDSQKNGFGGVVGVQKDGDFVTRVTMGDDQSFVSQTGYSRIRQPRRGVPTPRLDS